MSSNITEKLPPGY